MFTLFYRNTRLLILTIILIFVWGISSYFALPRLEDPELVSRNATVKTFLLGADAARIEALITDKIEDKFTEIEEIKDYSSTSSSGSSIIIIELKDEIQKYKVDSIWSRVQNKIDEVKSELPTGASEPELEKIKIKAYALITALTWQDDRPNYAILNRQAEVLKDRIQGIAGTEEVELYGDRPGVTLAVHVESGTRLDLWAKNADRVLEEYSAELPSAIKLQTILAQSNYVEDRLNGLILNLFLGGGLVFIVTLLMMGLLGGGEFWLPLAIAIAGGVRFPAVDADKSFLSSGIEIKRRGLPDRWSVYSPPRYSEGEY